MKKKLILSMMYYFFINNFFWLIHIWFASLILILILEKQITQTFIML